MFKEYTKHVISSTVDADYGFTKSLEAFNQDWFMLWKTTGN